MHPAHSTLYALAERWSAPSSLKGRRHPKDDAHGPLTAFAADICKAVTAAALGDAGKARFLSLPDEQHGLKALQAGKAELMPAATPDMRMSAIYGVAFGPPVFFDGQGFLISRDQGVAALTGLAGKPICYIGNTEADTMLVATAQMRNIKIFRSRSRSWAKWRQRSSPATRRHDS